MSQLVLSTYRVRSYGTRTKIMWLGRVTWDLGLQLKLGLSLTCPWPSRVLSPIFLNLDWTTVQTSITNCALLICCLYSILLWAQIWGMNMITYSSFIYLILTDYEVWIWIWLLICYYVFHIAYLPFANIWSIRSTRKSFF